MSILINMEMPKDCNHCRFAVDGWCYAYGKPNVNALANDGVTNWCPLVPVPPHGDLIDRAELLKRFCGHCFDENDPDWDFRQCEGECFDLKLIKHAPTIIPAEEGET